MVKSKDFDVATVDDFLSRGKSLVGNPPEWKLASRDWEYTLIWIIADDLGAEVAQLRFRWPKGPKVSPAVSLLLRGNPIWRVDLVSQDECKFNPHDAHLYGLPPKVCGPHEHAWPDNRHYVSACGFGKIPYRRPLPPQVKRFGQILPWLSDKIKLTLTAEQRKFDQPPQGSLFYIVDGN
jgi:hypothetical protein